MRDGQATTLPQPRLIVDDTLADTVAAPGIQVMGVTDWRGTLGPGGTPPVMADQDVLGIVISTPTASALAKDEALTSLMKAAEVSVKDLGASPAASEVLATALSLLAERYAAQQRVAGDEQRTLAQLRRQYMQVQDDYSDLETWVWDCLAPKSFTVRTWPKSAETLTLTAEPVVRQLLPTPVRGFIAIDVHIAANAPAGILTMRCVRPIGPAFEGMETKLTVPQGRSGWVTVQLPRAGEGAPQDVMVELSFESADGGLVLSLAPASPFEDYRAQHGDTALPGPLALRVRRTLPRLPALPTHDARDPAPADGVTRLIRPNDLAPVLHLPYAKGKVRAALRRYPDAPVVEARKAQNAVLVQPSTHRPVAALISGVKVESLRQARAIIQNSRHDSMEIAFALGAAPTGTVTSVEEALAHIGPWIHLLPAEWGEVWYDLPTPINDPADLLLVTAMPNMPFNRNAEALFHGFRLTGGTSSPLGDQ